MNNFKKALASCICFALVIVGSVSESFADQRVLDFAIGTAKILAKRINRHKRGRFYRGLRRESRKVRRQRTRERRRDRFRKQIRRKASRSSAPVLASAAAGAAAAGAALWSLNDRDAAVGAEICTGEAGSRSCFAFQCAPGNQLQFFLTSQNLKTDVSKQSMSLFVDGKRMPPVQLATNKTKSGFVAKYDADQHKIIIDALKRGKSFEIAQIAGSTFGLRGSSKNLKRLMANCGDPIEIAAPVIAAVDTRVTGSNASGYDAKAIEKSVAKIIASYQPSTVPFNFAAAAAKIKPASPPRASQPDFVDISGLRSTPWMFRRYYDNPSEESLISGYFKLEPKHHILANVSHKKALFEFSTSLNKYGGLDPNIREARVKLFQYAAQKAQKEFGPDHPAYGFALADYAYAMAYLADGELGIEKPQEESGHLFAEAAQLIIKARASNPGFERIIVENAMRAHIGAASATLKGACSNPGKAKNQHVNHYARAARLHLELNGSQKAQIGWLAAASRCETATETARISPEEGLFAAKSTGDQISIAKGLADYGKSLFLSTENKGAVQAYKSAIAIFEKDTGNAVKAMPFEDAFTIEKTGEQTVNILAELGLNEEQKLVYARRIQSQIKDEIWTSRIGAQFVTATLKTLEESGQFALADEYFTFMSDPVLIGGTKLASPVPQMSLVAQEAIDYENYDFAVGLLKRSLPIAEKMNDKNNRFTVLVQLAKATDEQGDLYNAGAFARDAVKLAKANRRLGRKSDVTKLNKIIATAAQQEGNQESVGLVLAANLQSDLDVACGPGGELVGIPSLPVETLEAQLFVKGVFLKADAVRNYLACTEANLSKIDGMSGGPYSGMQPRVLSDIIYLYAAMGDRPKANQLMAMVFDKSNWLASKSNEVLRTSLTPPFFDAPTKFRGIRKAKAHAQRFYLAGAGAVVEGLLTAGKTDWIEPYLRFIRYELNVQGVADRIDLVGSFDDAEGEFALALHSAGQADIAKQVYNGAKTYLQNEHKSSPEKAPCTSVSQCEFFATMERLYGDKKIAEQVYQSLDSKYTLENAGAYVDQQERDDLNAAALKRGLWHERTGRYRLAEVYYKISGIGSVADVLKAPKILISLQNVRTAASLARIQLKRGEIETARNITQRIVTESRERLVGSTAITSDSVLRWSSRLRSAYETFLDTASVNEAGDITAGDDEFFAMQYLQTTHTPSKVSHVSTRLQGKPGILARKIQDNDLRLSRLHNNLAAVKAPTATKLLRQIDALEKNSKTAAKTLQQLAPNYARRISYRFPTLKEIQNSLTGSDVAMMTFVGRDHTYVWLVGKYFHRLKRLSASPKEIENLVRNLRLQINDYLKTPREKLSQKAWTLSAFHAPYKVLVQPFEKNLRNRKRIIFVPNGAFDGLPLSALLAREPLVPSMTVGEMRETNQPWLVRRFAVNTVPSIASILQPATTKAKQDARLAFLGIGNPDFGRGIKMADLATRSVANDTIAISALPETEIELSTIATLLGANLDRDLLLGSKATETNVKAFDLSRYSVINFATHGVLASEIPGIDEPALLLSTAGDAGNDAILKASEISALRVDADLVILSACNTAGNDGRPGAEGLSGLASAFFYAGAKRLMVTHWEIPSASAVDLTVGTVQAVQAANDNKKQQDWAVALQRSTVSIIDQIGPAHNAHPAAWGAHVVVGFSGVKGG